jgi:hypothetical protein
VEWSERLSIALDQATEVEIEDAGDDMRVLHIQAPAKTRKGRQ